ncbi:MAG: hypothetical protein AB9882_11925 [Ignavibacteriaceae bacterium]
MLAKSSGGIYFRMEVLAFDPETAVYKCKLNDRSIPHGFEILKVPASDLVNEKFVTEHDLVFDNVSDAELLIKQHMEGTNG